MMRLVIDGLVKRFERVAVIDGVSLEVHPGELTFVLGPSGSGKTVLARLLAGLMAPDDGEIYFDGRAMIRVPPDDRRVGLVFQGDALWPHLDVASHVAYPLKVRKVGRRERRMRVEEAMHATRLEGLESRRIDTLTTVQRRRVALARALAIDPVCLVLDDPFAGLEGASLEEFRDDVRRLHAEQGTTTLVLAARPRDALASADRVAVLDLGRVVQSGTPWELYERPGDTFVAQFLGRANLLQGQLESLDGRGGAIVRTPVGRLVGQAPAIDLPGGSPVTVAIRPESLGLGLVSGSGAGSGAVGGFNRFSATVERQVLLGALREIHLRGPGDWPVLALALQTQAAGLREGQGLIVTIPPEQVIILPSRLAAAAAAV
jgi:ABC-type Fe3+/spermidine/putrescine transport system ATPase subunit